MTEAEWLACEDPAPMVRRARGPKSRKCRLLAVAWTRLLWPLLGDERSRLAVEAAEQFADDRISPDDLQDRANAAYEAHASLREAAGWPDRHVVAAFVAMGSAWNPKHNGPVIALQGLARAITDARAADGAAFTDFLRDIFGNPFRPVTCSPSWRTDTAVSLANQMYDSRDFGAMPILADALQDAGCDSEDILGHCRDANATHVRGCWVVDLVLNKK